MNVLKIGQIVRSRAGHDKNQFFVIMGMDGQYIYLADGKARPIAKPKRKKIMHVSVTANYIDTEELTDKRLRKIVCEFNGKHLNV